MTRGGWIALIAAETVALCCCAGLITLSLAGFLDEPSTPSAIAQVSATPIRSSPTVPVTQTAARTSTAVIQTRSTNVTLTPTRALITPPSNLYNVVVPTPTAARTLYPVDFMDTFIVVTYPVSGTTLAAIGRSLDANAMPDPHEPNSRFYARTDWQISYSPPALKLTPQGCELEKGGVTIALTMTLPGLVTTAPRDVTDRWGAFIQRAIVHESGHVRLGQDGARTFQRDLANLPPASDCATLSSNIRSLFNKSFTAIENANVQYDSDTRHGVTQGATFP